MDQSALRGKSPSAPGDRDTPWKFAAPESRGTETYPERKRDSSWIARNDCRRFEPASASPRQQSALRAAPIPPPRPSPGTSFPARATRQLPPADAYSARSIRRGSPPDRSEEHTSELQSPVHLV